MSEGKLLNDRYQLLERQGDGGMATVFRARDKMLERDVAIKLLHDDYSDDDEFRERFRQEARAAANLSHPNIVTVHDFGYDVGKLFIVMEYIPGADMKTLIRRSGRVSVKNTITLMAQACAGIGYAHRAGLVHCDVKPHNMLVTKDKRLKVTDFGIARALSSIQHDEYSEVVWGSPQYFSPEQATGAAPSPASDVYSLGIILYELLTGTLPFLAKTPEELARLHLTQVPVPLSEYVPDISPALEQIVAKVLAKEPARRYRTADQLGRVLETFGMREPNSALQPVSVPVSQPISEPALSTPTYVPNPDPTPVYQHLPVVEETPAYTYDYTPAPAPVSRAPINIDWASVGLGLLALLLAGGLIPFWMWIYFIYNPPIR
ncbi:MAG: protein kinase [Anaerolineae bacterium]|jgi:eukaryotic-like serine/threonine-protein kinase|nr:protein kinase [Anaerolineae bacterium]MBT7069427.1 protein kinase [Anaerolineae bacterium]MBT7324500.1 protein kinase [Anaerolineae bacterium]